MNRIETKTLAAFSILAVLVCSLLPNRSLAADGQASNRMARRLGFNLAVGEPSPGLIGINAAYNVTDYLRATIGYGQLTVTSGLTLSGSSIETTETTATTLGAGVRAMVPGWNLTPTLGLHYGHVIYSGSGLEVGGFKESGGHVYTSFGVNYQGSGGFDFGAGYQYSLKSGIGGSLFISAGWFFDWLG